MIKRIHYVSSFAQNMSDDEIEVLASQAAKKNVENDITGVLMAQSGIFFQIIEGPEEKIDDLFKNGSSAESVEIFRFRQLAKLMI